MSTTLNDVRLLTRDYIGQYSTGSVDDERVDRAINRAIEYVRREASFPSAERTHTFQYATDQLYYDVPPNFAEALYLKYADERMHTIHNAFDYMDYPQILEGGYSNRWSIVHHNGKPQILIKGSNQFGSTLLESADQTDGWVASEDASNLQVDTYIKTQGLASLSFDVTRNSGEAVLTKTNNPSDLRYIFDRHAYLKVDLYITEPVDAVTLKVKSSASDYYLMTVDQTDEGVPFPIGEWFTVSFQVEDAAIVGTPDSQNITSYEFGWELPTGFSPAVDFRLDNFYVVFPERLQLFFVTNIKGEGADGTEKRVLDTGTDKLLFSDTYDDYTDIVAQRAAVSLWPQIRGDMEMFIALRQDFQRNMKGFTKTFPRRRLQGSFKHSLRR